MQKARTRSGSRAGDTTARTQSQEGASATWAVDQDVDPVRRDTARGSNANPRNMASGQQQEIGRFGSGRKQPCTREGCTPCGECGSLLGALHTVRDIGCSHRQGGRRLRAERPPARQATRPQREVTAGHNGRRLQAEIGNQRHHCWFVRF